ncbi:MAG: ABC transporter substrate-binding protein [Ancrocorticia sp.]
MSFTSATRHTSRAVAAASALLLALVGCSSAPEESDPKPSESAQASQTSEASQSSTSQELIPPAEGTTKYPLTLKTSSGTSVLEKRPESVALINHWDLGLLASLGVTPIAGPETVSTQEWAYPQLAGEIETQWPWDFDNPYALENIAQVKADLFIDDGTLDDPARYGEISKIAPLLQSQDPGETTSWEERIRRIAEALDLSERAEKVITDTKESAEKYRADHPEFKDKTVALFVVWGGKYGAAVLNSPDSPAEEFFESLGFAKNPKFAELPEDGKLSNELVGLLDADVIIAYNAQGEGVPGDSPEFDAYLESPIFQQLPTAKAGKVITVSYDKDGNILVNGEDSHFKGHFGHALNGPDPLAIDAVREMFTPYLESAAK